jgi:hypothetical protein
VVLVNFMNYRYWVSIFLFIRHQERRKIFAAANFQIEIFVMIINNNDNNKNDQ